MDCNRGRDVDAQVLCRRKSRQAIARAAMGGLNWSSQERSRTGTAKKYPQTIFDGVIGDAIIEPPGSLLRCFGTRSGELGLPGDRGARPAPSPQNMNGDETEVTIRTFNVDSDFGWRGREFKGTSDACFSTGESCTNVETPDKLAIWSTIPK